MVGTTGFWTMRRGQAACLAAPLVLASAPVRAAEEDTQFWLYATAILPVERNVSATVELSPRAREQGDLLQSRVTFDLALSDHASVGAGVLHVELPGAYEVRPHQQLSLSMGPFSARSRIEQRFFDGAQGPADRAQIRLRQRFGASTRLSERTTLTGTAELLYIAQPEQASGKARVDNWRATVALQRRLAPRWTAAIGYLMILSPRENAADRISHVPQVTVVFRP